MEKFWNILHYFVYKAHYKAIYCFYKYTGMFKIYELPFAKRRMEKLGVKNPVENLMNAWKNPYWGMSTWYSYLFFNLAFMPISILFIFLYEKIFGIPNSPIPYIMVIIGWGAIIMVISHIYLMRKNKWIKYIRLYNKQPHKWKVKWAWISAWVLIMPLIITIIGIKLL